MKDIAVHRLQAFYKKHDLIFKQPAKTSRDTLTVKPVYYLVIRDMEKGVCGIGECSAIKGLSVDNEDLFEAKLDELCGLITFNDHLDFDIDLEEFPAIKFGFEIAGFDLQFGGQRKIFQNEFYLGNQDIPINGLIWMSDKETMRDQIRDKIEEGFKCIKLKIGALDFEDEYELLKNIRKEFKREDIELRVDANGAYHMENVIEILKRLSGLELHSIEQPIKKNNWEQMAELCHRYILPIALDEELIGVPDKKKKISLIQTIKPQFLVLKPSLLGGIYNCIDWIDIADSENIGWWVTSALESNIGLNAISQWVANYETEMFQGLGTGMLYQNNIPSPLEISNGSIHYNCDTHWDLSQIIDLAN